MPIKEYIYDKDHPFPGNPWPIGFPSYGGKGVYMMVLQRGKINVYGWCDERQPKSQARKFLKWKLNKVEREDKHAHS